MSSPQTSGFRLRDRFGAIPHGKDYPDLKAATNAARERANKTGRIIYIYSLGRENKVWSFSPSAVNLVRLNKD